MRLESPRRAIHRAIIIPLSILPVLLGPAPASAWNRSELDWKTIRTEHFSIHYHEGVERSAERAAAIAERVYGPVTGFYGYEPGRVHINISDRAGLAEGASFYYLNRIDIDPDAVEFHLRGDASWLENVIAHEFTHMVSLQVSMKMPRWMPAVYFQLFNFEKEKRPDVITGYPNFTVSLPFAGEVVPNWLAEGVAQYQASGCRSDIWDSHRDMMLRMAALGDRLLTIDQMGVFGKNSLEAEMLYNQGYSLVLYIAEKYGEESLVRLVREQSRIYRLGFGGASRKVLGISADELYENWRIWVTSSYRAVADLVLPRMRGGEVVGSKGFMNLYPAADTRGGVFFLSNMGRDYRATDLARTGPSGPVETLVEDVRTGPSVSKDGSRLCYSRVTDDNPEGYEFSDIFEYDPGAGEERRITRSLRAEHPEYSPEGDAIAAVARSDGKEFIVLIRPGVDTTVTLAGGEAGYRYTGLSWGERGLLASEFDGTSRNIILVDPATGLSERIAATGADERDPHWTDRNSFVYSCDRSGIFNIYRHDLRSGSDTMITNVIGGAFHPHAAGDRLYFAAFGADGYEIRRLEGWAASPIDRPPTEGAALIERRIACIGASDIPAGDPGPYDADPPQDYDVTYSPPFFFPRLLIYDRKFRVGLAVDSRDFIDRQSVYAAGSYGIEDGEFDLQLGFALRQFKPTFTFDLLRMRKYYEYADAEAGDVRLRYDLWDAYFTCRFELEQPTPFSRRDISLRYNHGEYGLNLNAWQIYDFEVGWTYYKADEISLLLDYRDVERAVDADINPRGGRSVHFEATRAMNDLSSGEFEYTFQPVYDDNDFTRLQLTWEEYLPLPLWEHSLELFARGGWIDRERIDDFFYLYLGSRDGLRGYSYYSIGGTKNAMGRATYRFPIWRGMDRQLPGIYLGSLYGAVFAEAGKAWNENEFDLSGNTKDVGFELRMKGFTFYSYPLAVSFSGAYGLDVIEYRDPFYSEVLFEEGNEWRYYGTVMFSF